MRRVDLPGLAVLLLLVFLLPSCVYVRSHPAGPQTDPNVIAVTGTVRHFDIEGGFFAIQGDDGVTYDPVHLDPRFRRDGLRVRMVAAIRRDLGGFHMVGPIVEIRRIDSE